MAAAVTIITYVAVVAAGATLLFRRRDVAT
jgi:hypothetical protein